jgi:hypothetical protein
MWKGGEATEILPPRSTSRLGRGDAVSSDRCPGRRRRNDQPDRQRNNEKQFTPLTCGFGAAWWRRCAPLWRADPRSKLAAAPLLAALTARAAEQGVADVEALARSKALKGDVRSVQAACRLGGAKQVKVETVERLCRKVLGIDPHELYGDGFVRAWQHRGKRVNARVQAFDHCFSSPMSVSLLAAAGSPQTRRLMAEGRAEALTVAIGHLERHGIGVRRDHNGVDRYQALEGLVAVAFEHRMSRSGDPNSHTHVLVQNAAQGPEAGGQPWTATGCAPS